MRIDRYVKGDAPAPNGLAGHPVFALGFRPLFLLAALLAALSLPLWLLVYAGALAPPLATAGMTWHAHEMVFGFAAAVVAGFLLTAVRNWTRQPVPTGATLAGLAALWVAGRLAVLFAAHLPLLLVAVVDAIFLPAVAAAIAIPIIRARNRRNAAFPVILLVLGGLVTASYAGDGALAHTTALAGVHVLILLLVLMGGRVIPFFTRNALPEARVRTWPWLDWTAFGVTLVWVVTATIDLPVVAATSALAAGGANLARLAGWGSLATLRTPLLWILHLGYLWVGVGLVMTGLGAWVPELGRAALHALTVGALGTLILGMMTRVSLGHTGRPLKAGRATVVAYVALLIATLLRVLAPLVAGHEAYLGLLIASAACWSLAFGLFVVVYWPILTRPRPDGAPG